MLLKKKKSCLCLWFSSWWNKKVRGSYKGFAFVIFPVAELESTWGPCPMYLVSQVVSPSATRNRIVWAPFAFLNIQGRRNPSISLQLWKSVAFQKAFRHMHETKCYSTGNHKDNKTQKMEALQTKIELLQDEWRQSQRCLLKQDGKYLHMVPIYSQLLFGQCRS